jgi:enolase
MTRPSIVDIRAREILDSKGLPMVEVDVLTSYGHLGRGSSPCGVSVGSHEAVVLRDGGERYRGLGVKKAISNVTEIIFPALKGKEVCDQKALDALMIELDGTPDKSRLGANAIYSVSIALARAAAASLSIPLFRYLNHNGDYGLPTPVFNLINGGTYGERTVEIQEFLLIPTGAPNFTEALRMGVEVFYRLDKVIAKRHGRAKVQIGKGAGYAAPVNEPSEILEILLEAAEAAGYCDKVRLGLDCAASQFYDADTDTYQYQGRQLTPDQWIDFLASLVARYPLCLIEDPLQEDDFAGHARITKRLDILISGDDLFVTNLARVKKGVALGAANAIVIKPNMVGTISEALETALYAKSQGYHLVPGGRSGGCAHDPIPDIAVALGSQLAKFGAPRAGEKINKYNRLLQIQDELGESARFVCFNRLK